MTKFNEGESGFYDTEYFFGLEFRYYSGAHSNKVRVFRKAFGDILGKKILDLGCGGGLFSKLLQDMGADVIGVDYSSEAISFAKERYPEVKYEIGSAYDLRFDNQSFDIVVMMDIIEHLSDQEKMLSEVHRVLKPGGKVVISTDLDDTYWHARLMDRFIWFSMRLSKEGRAYRLIKETESKIIGRKPYGSSHIGLLNWKRLETLVSEAGFVVERHEAYPLVRVWWRDAALRLFPQRARGEHQMLIARKA